MSLALHSTESRRQSSTLTIMMTQLLLSELNCSKVTSWLAKSECLQQWQVQSVQTPLAICTAPRNRLFSPRANILPTSPVLLSKQG